MSDLIIHGNVNADASIASGTGFTVIKAGTGLYLIDFDKEFSQTPSVVVTQNYKSWSDFAYNGGDTRDNAVLVAVNTRQAKVVTGHSDGSHVDRNFSFVALGPTV